MQTTPFFWVVFNALILVMLWLDLKVFHKEAHEVAPREALKWSVVWVVISLGFALGLYAFTGAPKSVEFLTGYIVEKSLSIDNIFVFSLIFRKLSIPLKYQHRVLFWGIFGALALRGLMIWFGIALISYFHPIIYILGAFLIFTGIKTLLMKEKPLDLEKHPLIVFIRRYVPLTPKLDGQNLWSRTTHKPARWKATPLFLALVLVECSDVIFAIDSIPAIFAITLDPFIVYTSNVFAILGLRSLYFLLADAIEKFYYLKPGVALILCFVGLKMIVVDFCKIPTNFSLFVILLILGGSMALSYFYRGTECHK
ncbi:MAG: TerC family protein [Alphaproteobacteria bacterium]|nr:TerC family protein [Alphaproteobacteria bacterium]